MLICMERIIKTEKKNKIHKLLGKSITQIPNLLFIQ